MVFHQPQLEKLWKSQNGWTSSPNFAMENKNICETCQHLVLLMASEFQQTPPVEFIGEFAGSKKMKYWRWNGMVCIRSTCIYEAKYWRPSTNIQSQLPTCFGRINTLPKTNMTGWKIHHEWRSISYWKWWFAKVMLVFRGVIEIIVFHWFLVTVDGSEIRQTH